MSHESFARIVECSHKMITKEVQDHFVPRKRLFYNSNLLFVQARRGKTFDPAPYFKEATWWICMPVRKDTPCPLSNCRKITFDPHSNFLSRSKSETACICVTWLPPLNWELDQKLNLRVYLFSNIFIRNIDVDNECWRQFFCWQVSI